MTLAILAVAGVISIGLFALKGVLDQLPDVIDSAGEVRDALERFKKRHGQAAKLDAAEDRPRAAPPADDEDPHMAA
ncbi:hypothetical protein ACWEL8_10980 [Streptomyces sp. NPDC004690]